MNPQFINISEAAKLSGLSAKTIRHYEDIGLLKPPVRTDAGYRQYNQHSVEQLSFIHHARVLGFSIAQVSSLLALKENPQRASREVKALAQQQLALLEARMVELQKMQSMLQDMIARCAGDDDPHCVILQELAEPESKGETK
ncbi:MAG: Cu(I)-responsive transcriptional regulator [Gammaproteobacteria bacterium]|nr:Cu(I)-responsive transcriptional regulator [Gammaproteobacteria bacterium]